MRIVAAVVTYNRRELLRRCIGHLQSQTRAPGSAGGWRRSIQYAKEEGYDAVWPMDDDGFPYEDALAALETAIAPDVACASSVVVENRPTHFVFPCRCWTSRACR